MSGFGAPRAHSSGVTRERIRERERECADGERGNADQAVLEWHSRRTSPHRCLLDGRTKHGKSLCSRRFSNGETRTRTGAPEAGLTRLPRPSRLPSPRADHGEEKEMSTKAP